MILHGLLALLIVLVQLTNGLVLPPVKPAGKLGAPDGKTSSLDVGAASANIGAKALIGRGALDAAQLPHLGARTLRKHTRARRDVLPSKPALSVLVRRVHTPEHPANTQASSSSSAPPYVGNPPMPTREGKKGVEGEYQYLIHRISPDPNKTGPRTGPLGRPEYYRRFFGTTTEDDAMRHFAGIRGAIAKNWDRSDQWKKSNLSTGEFNSFLFNNAAIVPKMEVITPKKQHELPAHEKPWSEAELQEHMAKQTEAFQHYVPGQQGSEYMRLVQEMRQKCHVERDGC